MTRYARLAALAWRDARAHLHRLVLLSLGVGVGVAALVLFLALGRGVEATLRHRLLGMMPDRIVVEPATMSLGFMKMSAPALDDATLQRLRAIPGVRRVLRRIVITVPSHMRASFNGKSFYTDIVVEAVDKELVDGDVPAGSFERKAPGEPIPAVIPSVLMDILNLGFSVNTGLPQLDEHMIVGRHFTANLGSSSFTVGPTISVPCVSVGLSPNVGVGGPSIPIDYLDDLRERMRAAGGTLPPLGITSAVLLLDSPEQLESVLAAVHQLQLNAPQEAKAAQLSAGVAVVSVVLSLFGVLVLVVAGTGITSGLQLMVRDEAGAIGLFRALGASQGDILLLYLFRAGLVGMLGGVAGCTAALLACSGVNLAASRMLPTLLSAGERLARPEAHHVALGLGFALLASMVAGAFPARAAARMQPLAALRERQG